ncbi:sensor histidine kinase [Streptomyces sp. NPDC088789]|uniref:sensor histidine kinase n=1 Tax=Streptomyces sp. NPDC088789 TaxID=3365899 RepID=UPI00381F3650
MRVSWARVRHEVTVSRAEWHAAGPRAVARDATTGALTAVLCLVPLTLVPAEHLVSAVLEAVWVGLLVAVRRLRPLVVVLGGSLMVMGDNVWTLPVVALLVLSATRRLAPPARAWRAVGAGCALVMALSVARVLLLSADPSTEPAGQALSAVLLLVLPAVAGTLLGRRRPLVSLLRERNAYLERARALTATAARAEERNRIAGEMHDLLGHRLSLISVHAGALQLATAEQAPDLTGRAELLRTTTRTALDELREILDVLRHEHLADPDDPAGAAAGSGAEERGTREDIAALVAEARRTGSAVELDWSVPDPAEVPARTRQAIHRVVREGLTNVLKHASGAPTRVEVGAAGEGIAVSVTNAVPSFSGPSRGGNRSGLAGCQERISLLGGTFAAGPLPGGGFRLAAWLPRAEHRTPPGAVPMEAGRAGAVALEEVHAPLSAEILTWPRVLGAGCAALVVVLPTAGFLVALLVVAVMR